MRCIPLALALVYGVSSVFAVTVSERAATAAATAAERRGRHATALWMPGRKTKRQVIRVPGAVSKLKLVQPPLNLRSNRAPQQFSRLPWRPPLRKSQTDFDFQMDNSFPFDPKKVKRNLKRLRPKESSPEEFYRGEAEPVLPPHRVPKKENKRKSVVKIKRKRPMQSPPREFWADDEQEDSFPETEQGPYYGHEAAGSGVRLQQVAAPSFAPQPAPQVAHGGPLFPRGLEDGGHVPPLSVNKLPMKGRQVQSLFAQQYTTHNPHVATNFGLPQRHSAVLYGPDLTGPSPGDRHGQPVGAASDHAPTSLPARTPAIQLVHPPQFRDVTATHPSHPSRLTSSQTQQREDSPSQKATMRDILDQDCPSHDVAGYCDSPPRYPMQQIKSMAKKCSDLMEAMNTQPFEEPQQPRAFAKRAAKDPAGRSNSSVPVELGADGHLSSWSRSANDGSSACHSEVEVIEPGYAKEVHSGKWFVIVQQPETTIQRIATDTCKSPGKPCAGLSELKCAKVGGLSGKATRCEQRHTSQRLISWDPESPEDCPRMRVFRFPSACTCHWDAGL